MALRFNEVPPPPPLAFGRRVYCAPQSEVFFIFNRRFPRPPHYAGPVDPESEVIFDDCVNIWRAMPTIWPQERSQVPKSAPWDSPRRVCCGPWVSGVGVDVLLEGAAIQSRRVFIINTQLVRLFDQSTPAAAFLLLI